MARHGENIRKRKDGRWEGRYPVFCAEKGKKVYRSVYGRTYEEAKVKLTTRKNLLKEPGEIQGQWQGEACARRELIFSGIAEEWLLKVKEKRKLSTYVKYSLVYRKYLKSAFQGTALSQITDSAVKEKLPGSISDSLQKSIFCVLNQILKFASRKYSVTMPNIKRPASCIRNKPIQTLAKKEQASLLSVLGHEMDSFKVAVLLCLNTGLRLGELCALKWSDIDFGNRLLMVNRTVQRITVPGYRTKTVLLETEPKSEHSKREIPLSCTALELLMRLRNGKEYVFGGKKAMEPRTMQYHFKKILQEAGLPDKNFHILRHTFATNCVESGTDIKSLSEMLGHSDVQITLNRYVHPSMDTKRRYLDVLSMFYGRIHGQASQHHG